jgi:hypothetical protein
VLKLSLEANAHLEKQGCAVTLAPTPEAIELYNACEGPVIALFHLTCQPWTHGDTPPILTHRP